MSHQVLDRVQETTTSTGTGALTLGGAVSKMLSFSGAGFSNGDTFWGLIEHATANEWEISLGTYSSSGPSITRSNLIKSSTGTIVDFSAGTKTISLVSPASKTPYLDNNGNAVFNGPIVAKGVRESVGTVAIASGTVALDLAEYTNFTVALGTNVTGMKFTNPPVVSGVNKAGSFSILVTADGTPRTWAMGTTVVALNGTYTPSSTNNKRDLLQFFTLDGGTTWFSFVMAQNF